MTLYCGIDLHSTNCLISIIDDADQVIFEKRVSNDLDQILKLLLRYSPQLNRCAVESTYNWYWLVDGLMDAGFSVRLANTVAMTPYQGLKHTNDHTDARFLAHLLRLGVLPTGYIYPKATRPIRDALRRRLLLIQQRTRLHLSVQSVIARCTGRRLSALKIKQLTRADVNDLLDDGFDQLTAHSTLTLMAQLTRQIDHIQRQVFEYCQTQHGYQLLTTVPGIGPVLGMTIYLETGNIQRFSKVGQYASYARCVSSHKYSNGKRKGRNNAKNGNKYLAMAFNEAAHYACIWDQKIKTAYRRKLNTSPVMVAKKAIANKLARAVYHMLKQQQPFDVNRAFA